MELNLSPGRSAFFIADLHLGAPAAGDTHQHQRRICRQLRDWMPRMGALFMLGDVMDYWFEYRNVAPQGFVRFLGLLAEIADSGTPIVWLKGNHDMWFGDYLAQEIGLTVLQGPVIYTINGRRFMMDHGDSVGQRTLGFKLLQGVFHNRILRKAFAAIHPRWTVALAHAWSAHSRLRDETPITDIAREPLYRFACEHSSGPEHADYYITGHRHLAAEAVTPSGATVCMLGDCFRDLSYAEFNGQDFSLHTVKQIRE